MCMWPQMIDQIFWPFAFKAVSKRINTLQVNIYGSTPESILYRTEVDKIPVTIFHTMFFPVYVLDSLLQAAGGAGPQEWEPRSRMGVYLVHSTFHAGIVALVFNPLTGRVISQYYLVSDDEFSTVAYMEARAVSPNWPALIK